MKTKDLDTDTVSDGELVPTQLRVAERDIDVSGESQRVRKNPQLASDSDSSVNSRCRTAFLLIYELVNYLSPGESLREEFKRLKEEWEEETAHLASPMEKATHPAYQRIIGMGMAAVPLILSELEKKPDHWFWALKAITGADPVPPEDLGKMEKMARDWKGWFKGRGLSVEKSTLFSEKQEDYIRKKTRRFVAEYEQFGKEISTPEKRKKFRSNKS